MTTTAVAPIRTRSGRPMTARPADPDLRTEARVDVPDGIDVVEVWGHDSFPASDPPANW